MDDTKILESLVTKVDKLFGRIGELQSDVAAVKAVCHERNSCPADGNKEDGGGGGALTKVLIALIAILASANIALFQLLMSAG